MTTGRPAARRRERPRIVGDLMTVAAIAALLSAVYLLPADTSLSELRSAGRLTACMPTYYPPLVTGDADAPGFDVELLQEIASRLGVSFGINANSTMVRDFNPRSWGVTRAQCRVLAGGVVLSNTTLSFMEGSRPYLSTGWAVVMPEPLSSLEGQPVGFYAGISGLDRIALSRELREAGARVTPVSTFEALAQGLADGSFTAGVTESLRARGLAEDHDWTVAWVSEDLPELPIGIGIWKGDLTLKRAINRILDDLEDEGFLDHLAEKYELPPIETVLGQG